LGLNGASPCAEAGCPLPICPWIRKRDVGMEPCGSSPLPSTKAAEFKNNSALPKQKRAILIAEGGFEISNADERQTPYANAGFSCSDHGAGFEVLMTLFQHADQKIRELFGFQPFDADAIHGRSSRA